MNMQFRRISTRVMFFFSMAMMVMVVGLFFYNQWSLHNFGYTKEIERAQGLTAFWEELRTFMGKLNESRVFASEELQKEFDESKKNGTAYQESRLYKTIPVVAAWTAARTRAEELGYEFRVPKNNPRNPLNSPRPGLEQAVINYLEGVGSLNEIEKNGGKIIYPSQKEEAAKLGEIGILHIGTDTRNVTEGGGKVSMNAVRFFRSIKLTQDCMLCHGDPIGSPDVLGFKKEGWQAGEVHGAFEIIAPLDKLDSQVIRASFVQFLIIGFFLIASLFLIYVLLKAAVTKPMQRLSAMLRDIAEGEGDLTKDLEVNTRDEIGEVAGWFNTFLAKLRTLITNIRDGASQVSMSSTELASSSQILAQAATQQAASLEETSASVEQLTSSIELNASNAEQTNSMTIQAAQEAEDGGKAVSETVSAMRRISEQISIIVDIADQTNLLALNAAIEAARAGEMGKGFAVVAVEVRKLAERSQEAAKEIIALSKDSVNRADRAGRIVQDMVPKIQKCSQMVQEIYAACSEQSTGAEQIRQSISQLDQVTQQNSSVSEESAAGSEELAAQAQVLKDLVARFKIEESMSKTVKFHAGSARKSAGRPVSELPSPGSSGRTKNTPDSDFRSDDEDEFHSF